ncbi:MAG: sensor histidine kinase [Acidimicrobiia bacterium]|nr:sensor histidine kinase [Acidimicrobiia bacterium]
MATLDELAGAFTDLDGQAVLHLQRLVASWSLLADLCFADLLLFAPLADGDGLRFVILGQIRPTTSQTLYREDQVGRVIDQLERPVVARSWQLGQIIDGELSINRGERARVQCIPVRRKDALVGILARESAPSVGRRPGELERVYVEIFDRFARMITTGEFPFPIEEVATEEAPRVGDGVLLLDSTARVEYASPNAISALHRMGMHANAEGARLMELGLDEAPVKAAFATGLPATEDVDQGSITLLVRCIPLLDHTKPTGAAVIVRDVTDLRRRDRLLLSKDATIREVHHRVKNNLQTISSLLRIQGRRMDNPEAKVAIEESVRRIRSIALVHETLSRGAGEELEFDEILRQLTRLAEEGLVMPDRSVQFTVVGDAGELRAEVATPLALVVSELLQNAVEHAFPDGHPGGHVRIVLENDGVELCVRVQDDGVGLPAGFSLEQNSSLGLTIVAALVDSEMSGVISLESRADGAGTVVELRIPVHPATVTG